MSLHARLLISGALLIAATAPAHTQAPDPQKPAVTFRVQVNYVEIDAIVTDRQGRFVRDLTKDDFRIFEEGKPQPVAAFSIVDIPVEPRVEPPTAVSRGVRMPLDVVSNARPFEGRVFMLLLDDLQTSVLNSIAVRERARAFVEEYVGANDLVAVVQTGSVGHNQDFTSDRVRLLAAIDRFTGTKRQSAASVILEERERQKAVDPIGRATPVDTEEPMRAMDAIRSMTTLKNVSSFLGGIRGRKKALVYVGEGVDYDIRAEVVLLKSGESPSITRDVHAVTQAIDDAIRTATRNNVTIYSLDPRGLTTGDAEAIASPGIAVLLPDAAGSKQGVDMLRDAEVRSRGSLRVLAESTGGIAFINTNDFGASLGRIVEDSSRHYILGYYAPEGRRDGRYRRIDVRVTKPGLEVRARNGYYAPLASAPAKADVPARDLSRELNDVMQGPLPVSGLAVSVSAIPFRGPARDASVAVVVELQPSRLSFTEQNGVFRTDIELQVNAIELASGKRSGTRHVAQLRLSRESHASVRLDGLRITRRVELPPGRYRLHVGARDSTGGAVGTVFSDLDVPDVSKSALEMSGLAIASAAATRVITANTDAALERLLPGAPTNLREFPPNDTLAVFAEVYGDEASTPDTVRVRTTVTAEDGTIAFRTEDDRRADAVPRPGTRTWSHGVTIPLLGMAPGRYVLQVDAGTSPQEPARVSRAVAFTVSPGL